MDEKTYNEDFFPLFLKLAAIQVKYKMNKTENLTDEEIKFIKIIKVLPSIIDRYVSNPQINLDDIKLDTDEITSTSETITKAFYKFDDFDPKSVDQNYLTKLQEICETGRIDLKNRLANKPYTLKIN